MHAILHAIGLAGTIITVKMLISINLLWKIPTIGK